MTPILGRPVFRVVALQVSYIADMRFETGLDKLLGDLGGMPDCKETQRYTVWRAFEEYSDGTSARIGIKQPITPKDTITDTGF